jgi:hypothetical protein
MILSLSSTDRGGACKSMNHAQKYLAQANRQIAELTVQIARRRRIVKYALDTGQSPEMAESLLDTLEGSLRIFERHGISLLSCSAAECGRDGPELVTTQRAWSGRSPALTAR